MKSKMTNISLNGNTLAELGQMLSGLYGQRKLVDRVRKLFELQQ